MSGVAATEERKEHPEHKHVPQHNKNHDDLLLRPPLMRPTSPDHDIRVRPMIYRMLIASNTLRLDTETRFTAIVLWHRYCAAIHLANPDDEQTTRMPTTSRSDEAAWAAAACLFLACKVEEEPLRLRDIINVAHMFLRDHSSTRDQNGSLNGSSSPLVVSQQPQQSTSNNHQNDNGNENGKLNSKSPIIVRVNGAPPRLDEDYWNTKEKIVRAEQLILRFVGFDTFVSKPHRAVPILLEELQLSTIETFQKWGLSSERIVPVAWKRLNDALLDSSALQHSVLELACASIGLAVDELTLSKAIITEERDDPWWNILEVSDASYVATKQALARATEGLITAESKSN